MSEKQPCAISYVPILDQNKIIYGSMGPWLVQWTDGQLRHGWKLHVSSPIASASEILQLVIDCIKQYPANTASFKCAQDSHVLHQLNDGTMGFMSTGKFITIYIWDQALVAAIAWQLWRLLDGHAGVLVPSDLALGRGLHARYGELLTDDHLAPTDRYDMLSFIDQNPFLDYDEFLPCLHASWAYLRESFPSGLYSHGLLPFRALSESSEFLTCQCLEIASLAGEPRRRVIKYNYRRHDYQRHTQLGVDILQTMYRIQSKLATKGLASGNIVFIQDDAECALISDFTEGETLLQVLRHRFHGLPLWALAVDEQHALVTILCRLMDAVEQIHRLGLSHGDLSLRNVLVAENDSISFIDLEYAVDESTSGDLLKRSMQCHTPGYGCLELSDAPPIVAAQRQDLYALGMILLAALSGLDPAWFAGIILADHAVLDLFHPCLDLARSIRAGLLHPDPLPDWRNSFTDLRKSPVHPQTGQDSHSWLTDAETDHQILGYLLSIHQELEASRLPHGLWETYSSSDKLDDRYSRRFDGGFNVGNGGIAFYLAKYASCFPEHCSFSPATLVDKLLSETRFSDLSTPGIHFGSAGAVYASLQILRLTGLDPLPWLRVLPSRIEASIALEEARPDLTHGLAGELLLLLSAAEVTGHDFCFTKARECCQTLCHLQAPDGSWANPQFDAGGLPLLGFAHGISGVLYGLALANTYFSDDFIFAAINRGISYLFGQLEESPTSVDGNATCLRFKNRHDFSIGHWWCHGEASAALMLLSLSDLYQDNILYNFACRLIDPKLFDTRGPVGNLSQCHGISGLGEVFLQFYVSSKDAAWLQRAERVVKLLVLLSRSNQFGPLTTSLPPTATPNPSLFDGFCGVGHFLLRYNQLLQSGTDLGHPAFQAAISQRIKQ